MYSGLNQSLKLSKRRLNIDSSSRCNLSCPGCGRTRDIAKGIQLDVSDMPMQYFEALVRPENKISHLTYNLSLSDPIYSGVFLEQMDYLKTLERRPKVNISTNASGRGERWWRKFASVMDINDRVEFAIDGLKDTNHIYRVNSNWDSIMLGVRTFRANWEGRMMWRYVIFEHNYHQVVEAQQLAKELGFDSFRPVVGDGRTPKEMLLKSKTWREIERDLSEM
jgi:sulfatase maturation enzyme AslB (radical SAM superfamily)